MKLNLVQTPYQLLNSGSELELALKPFQQASCFGLDCETAFGIDPYRAKVRLVQLAIPGMPVAIVDLFAIAPTDLSPLRSLLAGNALKVGHNLKFDWLMLTRAGLSPSKPFFDTYLAYRVLTAGLKRTSSLEAVADKLLKVKLDKAQQVRRDSGVCTPDCLQAMCPAVLVRVHAISASVECSPNLG